MYDYEKWQFTPEAEQQNPADYVKQAADLVHAQGLLFLTAPAVNLVTVMAPAADRNRLYDRICGWGLLPMPRGMPTSSIFRHNVLSATPSFMKNSSEEQQPKLDKQIQKY